MDRKELETILKEGEGYKIEFKEGFNNLDKEFNYCCGCNYCKKVSSSANFGKLRSKKGEK